MTDSKKGPILISHRGNLNGSNTDSENNELQIEKVISLGFDCEIDLWLIGNDLFLGHDAPSQKTSIEFINKFKNNLWCHAKNKDVFVFLKNLDINTFWHESDRFTLTSKGHIWCYPSEECFYFGINVNPELNKHTKESMSGVFGICSDCIENFM